MKTSECSELLAKKIITKPKKFGGRDCTSMYFYLRLTGIEDICSFYGYSLKERRKLITKLTKMIINRDYE